MQTDATHLDVTCCICLHTLLHVVGCCCTRFETGQTFSYMQTDTTIPNIVRSTMLGIVDSVCTQLCAFLDLLQFYIPLLFSLSLYNFLQTKVLIDKNGLGTKLDPTCIWKDLTKSKKKLTAFFAGSCHCGSLQIHSFYSTDSFHQFHLEPFNSTYPFLRLPSPEVSDILRSFLHDLKYSSQYVKSSWT